MKRIGLLALAAVLALGLVAAGFAHWTETLTIEDPVTLGEVDVKFAQSCNTMADHYPAWAWGAWDAGEPVKLEYNIDRDTLTVGRSKLYPGARFGFRFAIKNEGTIPAKIKNVEVTNVKINGEPAEDVPDWLRGGGLFTVWGADGTGIYSFNLVNPWNVLEGYDLLKLMDTNPAHGGKGLLEVLQDKVPTFGVNETLDFDDPDGGTMVIKVDKDAGNEMENVTVSFDVVFTWTQFNDPLEP